VQAVRGTVHAPPSTVAPTVPDLALPSSRSYGAPILLLPSVDEALAVLGRGDSGWLSCWLCGTSGKRHQTRPVQQPTKIFPAILVVRESSSPVVGNCGNNKSTACEGLDLLLLLLCRMHLFQVPAAQTSIHTIPYLTYTRTRTGLYVHVTSTINRLGNTKNTRSVWEESPDPKLTPSQTAPHLGEDHRLIPPRKPLHAARARR
jgi:hypothetical protein